MEIFWNQVRFEVDGMVPFLPFRHSFRRFLLKNSLNSRNSLGTSLGGCSGIPALCVSL